ncbi:TetR/AcrR family transcriptional regulator [Rhizobium sp. 42MFCr.1]|uniref:TetR/AcrR family transcriptional regulator n=1 Tax=Rhizobium sp. 42MFCr.1 TaxID=1048680 RepID=UPI0003757C6A|nr:TetR family transcriptional regulator [Rhizobium sp. 42MFCr.1]
MRYEKGHKESTRNRIIDVASRRFRKDGASATGLAGIMADAGLTNGAFYAHFGSKETLLRETLVNTLADQAARSKQDCAEGRGIEGAIRGYLNKDHLERSEEGCPSAALLPEIGRQPQSTREAYENGLLPYIKNLASQLPQPGTPSSIRRAIGVFGVMVGTLQTARAVSDMSLAEDILEAGIEAALVLARKSEP